MSGHFGKYCTKSVLYVHKIENKYEMDNLQGKIKSILHFYYLSYGSLKECPKISIFLHIFFISNSIFEFSQVA